MCVCVCVCVYCILYCILPIYIISPLERERVCVCVCERERDRECLYILPHLYAEVYYTIIAQAAASTYQN